MPPNERSPRSHRGGPANITDHPHSITRPCDVLLARLDRVKKSPRGWSARCPGPNHQRADKSPSLSVAELEPRQAHADIVAAWNYLMERVDIPAVIQLASLIRGAALFRYCAPDRCEDADVARAVRRLTEELASNG